MNTTFDSRPMPPGSGARRGSDLLDDLAGGQIPAQAALAGRAERAPHATPGLTGHAHGDPIGVAHEHALDEGAVVQPPERLARRARVRRQLAHLRQQGWQQRVAEATANPDGQLGHRRCVALQSAEVLPGQLISPEGWQTERNDRGPTRVAIEVSQVARRCRDIGCVEDQRQTHGVSAGWAESLWRCALAARSAFWASISASSASVMAKPTNHDGSMVR